MPCPYGGIVFADFKRLRVRTFKIRGLLPYERSKDAHEVHAAVKLWVTTDQSRPRNDIDGADDGDGRLRAGDLYTWFERLQGCITGLRYEHDRAWRYSRMTTLVAQLSAGRSNAWWKPHLLHGKARYNLKVMAEDSMGLICSRSGR